MELEDELQHVGFEVKITTWAEREERGFIKLIYQILRRRTLETVRGGCGKRLVFVIFVFLMQKTSKFNNNISTISLSNSFKCYDLKKLHYFKKFEINIFPKFILSHPKFSGRRKCLKGSSKTSTDLCLQLENNSTNLIFHFYLNNIFSQL